MRVLRRTIALAALLAAWPTLASAVPVIAFGDSWANQSSGQLYSALDAAGYSTLLVQNSGIGGTTAHQYANVDPAAITNAIAANPDAEWIYLSVTGNDTFDHYTMGMAGTSAATNDANLRTILDNVFLAYPDIRVVMFGYARTNFVQSAACMTQAEMFFGVGITQAQINAIFETEVGAVMSAVAATYPNVTYVPLWGSLQVAAGQANNANNPSPAVYMQDCFHLNATGYRTIHGDLVAAYWDSETPPTASFTDDGTARCVGETITFTNTSMGATRVRWFVDGTDSGTNNTLAVPLNVSGTIDVDLRAFNNVWSNTASEQIVVGPCTDAGVPDAGEQADAGNDAGEPDTGVVDPDAGPTADAGMVGDAGEQPDAGLMPDSGQRDSGPFVSPDAGMGSPDAGGPTGPGTWDVGGGCTTTSGDPTLWTLGLFLLLIAWNRRRHQP